MNSGGGGASLGGNSLQGSLQGAAEALNALSAIRQKALTLANKLSAPSPGTSKLLAGSRLSVPNPDPSPEGQSETQEVVRIGPHVSLCAVDDATITIQPAPSPPVQDVPWDRGGVSRDWSVIFEVFRDEYKAQVA